MFFNFKTIDKRVRRYLENFDDYATVIHSVGERLVERLTIMRISPKVVVDCGARSGYTTSLLMKRFPQAQVIACDWSATWLETIKKNPGLEQVETRCIQPPVLPFSDQSVDLIFSNLWTPWFGKIENWFSEVQRVLKPNGLVIFSCLGPDSFYEWQQIGSKSKTIFNFDSPFFNMQYHGDKLFAQGFINPVVDREIITLHYDSFQLLLADCRYALLNVNFSGLITQGQLKRWQKDYLKFLIDGSIWPVSLEIIYGHAWQSEQLLRLDQDGKEIIVPIEKLLNALKA